MIPAALCLLAIYFFLFTAGLIMLVRAAKYAPRGFEDARGFHTFQPAPESAVQPQTPTVTPVPIPELLTSSRAGWPVRGCLPRRRLQVTHQDLLPVDRAKLV